MVLGEFITGKLLHSRYMYGGVLTPPVRGRSTQLNSTHGVTQRCAPPLPTSAFRRPSRVEVKAMMPPLDSSFFLAAIASGAGQAGSFCWDLARPFWISWAKPTFWIVSPIASMTFRCT